jgi:hypothetical protein
MSEWERHANHSLRSLGDALQRGQLDRAEYRARRRRILHAGSVHNAQTQPNALQPSVSVGTAPAAPASPSWGRWLAVGLAVGLCLGLLAWWGGIR